MEGLWEEERYAFLTSIFDFLAIASIVITLQHQVIESFGDSRHCISIVMEVTYLPGIIVTRL